jgi:tripartite-type tricarboxylate transporter receptor subunit TctC
MKLPRRRFLHVAVGAAAIPAASGVAKAEVYPSRTITMIVPIAPGVGTDALARILAEHMRGTLGQSIIVENITGAGGTIGTTHVARAVPDGYTLSVGNIGTHVISPATYPNIQYHPLKDFEPIALIATSAYWLIAKNALPPKDLTELIVWLKANLSSHGGHWRIGPDRRHLFSTEDRYSLSVRALSRRSSRHSGPHGRRVIGRQLASRFYVVAL